MCFYFHQYIRILCLVLACVICIIVQCNFGYCQNVTRIPYEYTGSHQSIIKRYYARRKDWNTSNLGAILFKNLPREKFLRISKNKQNKTFHVLMWNLLKSGIEPRHVENNNLKNCSVNNCIFTTDSDHIKKVDVVVINTYIEGFPKVQHRKKEQIWVIWTNENPMFMMPNNKPVRKLNVKYFASIANMIMNFRTDSDVPIPYGRTVPLRKPLYTNKQFEKAPFASFIPNWTIKSHDVLVGVLLRHYTPAREETLKEILNYIEVDVYGKIGTNDSLINGCPGVFDDCTLLDQYIFYLSFENARCHQYMTEKVFHFGYAKGAIPVILGASLKDCADLLPPNSYVHIDEFASTEDLAAHLKNVAKYDIALREYHRWRNHFAIHNEHGFFHYPSKHFCRLCKALNYNEVNGKIYTEDDINYLFDVAINCNVTNSTKTKKVAVDRDDQGTCGTTTSTMHTTIQRMDFKFPF